MADAPGGPGNQPDLDEQRQGHGRLRARRLAAVVHARLRHRQRGLLPARRHPADPRPRLHRRRRRRLLVRGQARRELSRCDCWRRACRRSRSSTQHARYQLRLRITPDPRRDVLVDRMPARRRCRTRASTCWWRRISAPPATTTRAAVERYRGRRVLWAEQGPFGVALAAVDEHQADAFGRASAGYVGSSDGWQDFARNGAMTWQYQTAGPGNVALMGELPRRAVLALGFGSSAEAAATLAISSLIAAVRQHPAAADRRLGGLAGASAAERSPLTLDLPEAIRDQVVISADRAARPSRQDLSRRDGGEPQRAVGRHRQRARRLSSGVAARSRAMRRRAAGVRRRAGGARHAALPDRDADRRRPLAPEPVARRHALLAGHPARRDRAAGVAGRGARGARRAARHRGRGHGRAARSATSPAPGRRPSRTAGRRTKASMPSPWR